MKRTLCMTAAVLATAVILTGCRKQSPTSTLFPVSDSEVASIFQLSEVLTLGAKYLDTLDYENAILQYIEIIQHDPKNRDAYAGLFAAYAAQGKDEEAQEVLRQAQKELGSEDEIVGLVLDNADNIYQHGGGTATYRFLSEHYYELLDKTNSTRLKEIGERWMSLQPDHVEPYTVLGTYYAYQGDSDGVQGLKDAAEENGISFDQIETEVQLRSDGSYTLTLYIESPEGEPDTKAPLQVEVKPDDDAAAVTSKIASRAAENATQSIASQEGLNDAAASAVESMVQSALQEGLSATDIGSDMSFFFGADSDMFF